MSSPAEIDEEYACNDTSPVWPILIATSSVLLGYLFGRISYRRDLEVAVRQIEESSEPTAMSIRTR